MFKGFQIRIFILWKQCQYQINSFKCAYGIAQIFTGRSYIQALLNAMELTKYLLQKSKQDHSKIKDFYNLENPQVNL